eukprot:TRINITY_DN4237_c1_g1_i1.p1 TRINITY_DN4237_c1_g1~~TRINITY_DN4237_c1_g1_i1.p1  ORF type:complete len:466 (+),score=181.80 TRINITY_DN4237_c1_g1_i1:195-1592(+)
MADAGLNERIVHQVEYYFSPDNLCRPDKWLLGKLQYDEADGHASIPLKTVADFNKVRQITTDVGVLRAALQGSEVLGVVDSPAGEALIVVQHLRRAPRTTLSIRELPPTTTEQQVRELVGGNPTSARGGAQGWYCVFQTEGEAQQALQTVSAAQVDGHPVSARLRSEGIRYTREAEERRRQEMEQARQSQGRPKAEKLHYLPLAMRPLLIGHKGANIKKLQEQFKSLEVDTHHDDFQIKLRADDEETLERASEAINKFFQPPAENPEQPIQQMQMGAQDQWGEPMGMGGMPMAQGMLPGYGGGMGLPMGNMPAGGFGMMGGMQQGMMSPQQQQLLFQQQMMQQAQLQRMHQFQQQLPQQRMQMQQRAPVALPPGMPMQGMMPAAGMPMNQAMLQQQQQLLMRQAPQPPQQQQQLAAHGLIAPAGGPPPPPQPQHGGGGGGGGRRQPGQRSGGRKKGQQAPHEDEL